MIFSDMQGVPSTIKALSISTLLYSIRLIFFIGDKGMFKVLLNKTNVQKDCFGL